MKGKDWIQSIFPLFMPLEIMYVKYIHIIPQLDFQAIHPTVGER